MVSGEHKYKLVGSTSEAAAANAKHTHRIRGQIVLISRLICVPYYVPSKRWKTKTKKKRD